MSADGITHLPGVLLACEHGRMPCSFCTQRELTSKLHAQMVRHEEWKEEATDKAHDWANENNLCGTFDDFMESIGLRRRERDYTVTVTVTLDVEIKEIRASNARDAEQEVTEDQVADAIRRSVEYREFDWSVERAEVED